MHDPCISRQFHEASQKKNKSKFEALTDALKGGISDKISLKKTKFRLGGIISLMSETLGHRLTAPEIKDLFDAVAVDKGIDELIDTTFPDSPEAFSRAIHRERAFWKALP